MKHVLKHFFSHEITDIMGEALPSLSPGARTKLLNGLNAFSARFQCAVCLSSVMTFWEATWGSHFGGEAPCEAHLDHTVIRAVCEAKVLLCCIHSWEMPICAKTQTSLVCKY